MRTLSHTRHCARRSPPHPHAQPAVRTLAALRRLAAAGSLVLAAAAPAAEDALAFVQFVQEPAANCVTRNGMQILVKSTHPSRTVKVWLDRFHMGVGTGDRSRSVLPPGAEPEPLGCSRSTSGVQEWRPVKAEFVD